MPSPNVNPNMEYRRLGASGLRVSVLSFGSWVTFGNQLDTGLARDCIDAAGDAGCNFFDNAEVYAGGESETIMGRVFRELGWPRWSYVLTTKAFWGIHRDVPNMNNTLNRKYLMQSIDGSLERLQTDFVDVFYAHRADPETPMEEVVFAMSEIISAGKAHYWGTSEWTAEQVREAMGIAEKHGLHKPVTEQSQYNLLERRIDTEFAQQMGEDLGVGLAHPDHRTIDDDRHVLHGHHPPPPAPVAHVGELANIVGYNRLGETGLGEGGRRVVHDRAIEGIGTHASHNVAHR